MQNFSDGPQQLLSVSVFKDSPDLTSEKAHKAVGKKKKTLSANSYKKVSLGILCVKNYDQREQMLCQWRKAKLAKVQIYSATQGYTQGTWVNIPFTEAFSGE